VHGLEILPKLVELGDGKGEAHERLAVSGVGKVTVPLGLGSGEGRHRVDKVKSLLGVKVEDPLGVGISATGGVLLGRLVVPHTVGVVARLVRVKRVQGLVNAITTFNDILLGLAERLVSVTEVVILSSVGLCDG